MPDPRPPLRGTPTFDPYASPQARLAGAGVDTAALPLASPWARLAARTVDTLLYGLAALPLLIMAGVALAEHESGPGAMEVTDPLFIGAIVLSGVLMAAVFAVHLAMWSQRAQSPGKFLLGLRIVRIDGEWADPSVLVVRRFGVVWVVRVVLACIGVGPIFDLVNALMVFTDQGRTVRDRIAGTVVVTTDWEPPGRP